MVYEVLKSDSELIGERRRAMCQYRCDICGGIIKMGEVYDSARGMTPVGTSWEDGDRVPPRYWTFRTHLYHCGVPLRCQMELHDFRYRPQKGDPDDIFDFDVKTEGTFCIYCGKELTPENNEQRI